jgi:hypothetical protein
MSVKKWWIEVHEGATKITELELLGSIPENRIRQIMIGLLAKYGEFTDEELANSFLPKNYRKAALRRAKWIFPLCRWAQPADRSW